ncbi:hypothetical protein So717_32050 [Roseobacter cerasinus]|uniref:Heme NO-binding domain-containing protein n=1 Tax=Roseobacter cerasinus TaxID=2602289 RepID=A0A640VUV8_9RHOB|nr:heme NO-binding domain-containing protein [Roseobacter cerasinus]GFE51452.1 hypothetical protein So717_32050 [Roseobacter cerasinus]
MYGMVNEGIRSFVLTHHGAQTWDDICQIAALPDKEFQDMQRYDDSVTYELVGAISDRMELSDTEAMTAFGSYWIDYAGGSRFGPLMTRAGPGFLDQLRGLDDMHAQVKHAMPDLRPPSFTLEHQSEDIYHLHYVSQRSGLDAMVIGMLHGLAEETGESIDVRQVAEKSDGVDHSVFEITLLRTG